MPSAAEILRGLLGAWRLLRLDAEGGLACFEDSPLGAARSFWAAALTAPIALVTIFLDVSDERWAAVGAFQIFAVNLISYVIGWTLLPVTVYYLAHWLGRAQRFWLFLSALNWSNVIQSVAWFAATSLVAQVSASQGAPEGGSLLYAGLVSLIALALTAGVIAYEWYVVRVSLDAGAAATTAIVLIDLVYGIVLSRITDALS